MFPNFYILWWVSHLYAPFVPVAAELQAASANSVDDIVVMLTVKSFKRDHLEHRAKEATPSDSGWKTIDVYTGPHVPYGNPKQLHSQAGQDWTVATLLGCKYDGYFIDLAANDAMQISNTLMLERDFNWNGICIEANMQYMYGLAKRQCKVVEGAVGGPRDEKVQFDMRGVVGGIVSNDTDNKQADGQVVDFHMIPLADVLENENAPSLIDYLSLDVEGAESIVMENFPWDKYKFKVITVERPKADLQGHLTDHGYRLLKINSDWDDETWVHQESLPNATSEQLASSCMTSLDYAAPTMQGFDESNVTS
jgi:hypothetical protein